MFWPGPNLPGSTNHNSMRNRSCREAVLYQPNSKMWLTSFHSFTRAALQTLAVSSHPLERTLEKSKMKDSMLLQQPFKWSSSLSDVSNWCISCWDLIHHQWLRHWLIGVIYAQNVEKLLWYVCTLVIRRDTCIFTTKTKNIMSWHCLDTLLIQKSGVWIAIRGDELSKISWTSMERVGLCICSALKTSSKRTYQAPNAKSNRFSLGANSKAGTLEATLNLELPLLCRTVFLASSFVSIRQISKAFAFPFNLEAPSTNSMSLSAAPALNTLRPQGFEGSQDDAFSKN